MNNKGFAITTILYGVLLLFLLLFVSTLGILSSYKDRLEMLIENNNGARDIINKNYNKLNSKNDETTGDTTSYDRIHFISNGDAFYTFIKSNTDSSNKGPSPSETILLESNGKFALIDAGLKNTNKNNTGRVDYVLNYLETLGVKELEFMLITHVHYDHMGGALEIIKNENIKTKKLYMKVYYGNDTDDNTDNTNRYDVLEKEAKSQEIFEKINANSEGKELTLGNMKIKLYATKNLLYHEDCYGQDENINSIVSYIEINGKKVLLTGDMEPTTEACLKTFNADCDEKSVLECVIKQNNITNINLLKLPHHGYSSCDINNDIKTALNPEYIVITNWSEKVNYYYKGIDNGNGTIGPVYSSNKYKSCIELYFASSHSETDPNKTAYYVNNNNVVFDFTKDNISIYNITLT